MPTAQENIRAFDRENGDDYVRIEGMLFFRNGARREANSYGALIDPPDNKYERLKLKAVYWEEHLRRAIEEFSQAKGEFVETARGNAQLGYEPLDKREVKQVLEPLQRRTRLCERKLDLIRDAIDKTPEVRQRERTERQTARNRAAGEEIVQFIKKFRI